MELAAAPKLEGPGRGAAAAGARTLIRARQPRAASREELTARVERIRARLSDAVGARALAVGDPIKEPLRSQDWLKGGHAHEMDTVHLTRACRRACGACRVEACGMCVGVPIGVLR